MKYIERVLHNPEEDVVVLLDALHETVYQGSVPAKAIAYQLGLDLGNLSTMCSPRSLEKGRPKFPLIYLPKLVEITGDKSVLYLLCSLCGGVFVDVSDFQGDKVRDVLVEVKKLLGEVSEFIDTYLEATDDDVITIEELDRIAEKAERLVSRVFGLKESANILAY